MAFLLWANLPFNLTTSLSRTGGKGDGHCWHDEVRSSHISAASAARTLVRANGLTTLETGLIPDSAFD